MINFVLPSDQRGLLYEAIPFFDLEFGMLRCLVLDTRFSNRPFGVKRFQIFHRFSSAVVRG